MQTNINVRQDSMQEIFNYFIILYTIFLNESFAVNIASYTSIVGNAQYYKEIVKNIKKTLIFSCYRIVDKSTCKLNKMLQEMIKKMFCFLG